MFGKDSMGRRRRLRWSAELEIMRKRQVEFATFLATALALAFAIVLIVGIKLEGQSFRICEIVNPSYDSLITKCDMSPWRPFKNIVIVRSPPHINFPSPTNQFGNVFFRNINIAAFDYAVTAYRANTILGRFRLGKIIISRNVWLKKSTVNPTDQISSRGLAVVSPMDIYEPSDHLSFIIIRFYSHTLLRLRDTDISAQLPFSGCFSASDQFGSRPPQFFGVVNQITSNENEAESKKRYRPIGIVGRFLVSAGFVWLGFYVQLFAHSCVDAGRRIYGYGMLFLSIVLTGIGCFSLPGDWRNILLSAM